MTSTADFEALIEPYHEALGAIINGDPSGYKSIFSQRDDVTLGNPFSSPFLRMYAARRDTSPARGSARNVAMTKRPSGNAPSGPRSTGRRR